MSKEKILHMSTNDKRCQDFDKVTHRVEQVCDFHFNLDHSQSLMKRE
jgi:hypothetical protein